MKKALVLAVLGFLAACGGEDATGPTTPLPNVAGTYNGNWLVQFRRHHDGFSGSFYCYGSVTLAQSSTGALTGFSVISASCPAASFDLSGSVGTGGSVTFTTGGPRPSVGQCPVATGASYTGVVTDHRLSARATVELNCPGPGEGAHTFDYILDVWTNG